MFPTPIVVTEKSGRQTYINPMHIVFIQGNTAGFTVYLTDSGKINFFDVEDSVETFVETWVNALKPTKET